EGLCAKSGSASSSGSLEPSHVIQAMGDPERIGHGAIRISLSRFNTEAEIDEALAIVPRAIERLRVVQPRDADEIGMPAAPFPSIELPFGHE
ncbi:MAG: hypothetical protein HY718_09615, partial [Planctomycetes bacterium]|nr:hypothetical protein [Planctomycetota bacterium]